MISSELAQATFDGDLARVRDLLVAGADPDEIPDEGWSALHAAIEQLNVEGVRLLLDAQADPDLRDRSGYTPLFHAVDITCDAASQGGNASPDEGGLRVILLLHERGANCNLRSNTTRGNRTPAQIAREYAHVGLAEQLESIARYQPPAQS